MFDIGFFEIMVIAVVGLLVIGPERLPETLRTLALLAGRVKRGLRDTRQELEKQIGADEIRRQLHNEEILARVEKTRRQINEGIDLPRQLGQSVLDDYEEPQSHQFGTHEPGGDRQKPTQRFEPSNIDPDIGSHDGHQSSDMQSADHQSIDNQGIDNQAIDRKNTEHAAVEHQAVGHHTDQQYDAHPQHNAEPSEPSANDHHEPLPDPDSPEPAPTDTSKTS